MLFYEKEYNKLKLNFRFAAILRWNTGSHMTSEISNVEPGQRLGLWKLGNTMCSKVGCAYGVMDYGF